MSYLLSTTTEGIKLNLLQSVLGCSQEKIKNKSNFISNGCYGMPLHTEETSPNVLEIQLDDSTLTCFFQSNAKECNVSYLFPENESEIQKYVDLCNKHYAPFSKNLWVNQKENTCIRLSRDSDVGYMLTCTKIGNN